MQAIMAACSKAGSFRASLLGSKVEDSVKRLAFLLASLHPHCCCQAEAKAHAASWLEAHVMRA